MLSHCFWGPMLPIIMPMSDANLHQVLAMFPGLTLLKHESREHFSAHFPRHNRYFSNGDKPFVALVKKRGQAVLRYGEQNFDLGDHEFVFFDDNVPHSWIMRNSDLDIFYYRQDATGKSDITDGDYCLDNYFT